MTTIAPAVSALTVQPALVQAVGALFDDGLPVPGPGDILPPLWHWAALASWPAAGTTGADGHPAVGGIVPPRGKPRRMFAGGSVTFMDGLVVGDSVRQEQLVTSVEQKRGRSGDFIVVRTETRVFGGQGRIALVETQDLVYRDAAPRPEETSSRVAPPAAEVVDPLMSRSSDGAWRFVTDPTKLIRFSSATCNSHRIHYDEPYAVGVEGYPGLVVHGPLMTMALAEVIRLSGFAELRRIEHRNHQPLFCGEAAEMVVEETEAGGIALELRSPRGVHVTAVATRDAR